MCIAGNFINVSFKCLAKVGANKGVIVSHLKQKSWPGGGVVSGQPKNPPGYATDI